MQQGEGEGVEDQEAAAGGEAVRGGMAVGVGGEGGMEVDKEWTCDGKVSSTPTLSILQVGRRTVRN